MGGSDYGQRRRSASPRSPRDNNNPKKRSRHNEEQDELPQPYNAKALHAPKRRAFSPSADGGGGGGGGGGGHGQPRKLKRPGRGAQLSTAEREIIRQRQVEREREQAAKEAAEAERIRHRGINDVVRQHYNSVPERGRDWRKTDSKIKGLRSFNNWVKSCIIQKFSPDEDFAQGVGGRPPSREDGGNGKLLVLDIGCGKGGDLGKWQQAPQPVGLYVGLDPADVSITQAKDRFRSMADRGGGGRGGRGGGGYPPRRPPRIFDARFHVKDCFGETIEDLPIVREVGFDTSPMARHGFDVVSMMFCMHYAFESEQKARTMLRNVAGALKKGGRFIGCIPNSDVLGEHVRRFNEKKKEKEAAKAAEDKEKNGGVDAVAPTMTKSPTDEANNNNKKDDKDAAEEGEAEEGELEEGEAESGAEWGNSIYHVRFPGTTPEDGVFRPAFGWKYLFFLDEAVQEVPEYVVPWEAFRALAEDFNLELRYHKTFPDIWRAERDDPVLGPLSERMGVRDRGGDRALLVSDAEMEAAGFYVAFCFDKV